MEQFQERRPGFRSLGKVLIFMLLLGVLGGIIATRAEKHNPGLTSLFDDVGTVLTGLMLVGSCVVLYLSVRLYIKHGIRGRLIGFTASTMFMLAIFLRQVAPEN